MRQNKIMIKILLQPKIVIYSTLFLLLFGLTTIANAAGLNVSFQNDPLFYDVNVAPGLSVSRTVTVVNNGPNNESVYFDTKDEYSDGLAAVMRLEVDGPTSNYYNDYFASLFSGPTIPLGTLSAGQSRTYNFTASLDTATDNSYQVKTMGFGLCVGFSGGSVLCDDGDTSTTTITTPPGGGGGGTGGGGTSNFRLFNETVIAVNPLDSSATIAWQTNRGATTYLVCGNLANGPFDLNPTESYFGYEFSVAERENDSEEHIVIVTVGESGTYECRPASREDTDDDFSVGKALRFIIPGGAVAGASTNFFAGSGDGFDSTLPAGAVLGAATNTDTETTDEGKVDGMVKGITDWLDDSPLSETGVCTLIWLLILIFISLTWSVLADRLNREHSEFRPFFNRQLIFSAVYTVLLLVSYWLNIIGYIWYVFLFAWVVMTAYDYRAHYISQTFWDSRSRNIYFGAWALLFTLTSLFFGFPCVWWPFFGIAIASLLLLILD